MDEPDLRRRLHASLDHDLVGASEGPTGWPTVVHDGQVRRRRLARRRAGLGVALVLALGAGGWWAVVEADDPPAAHVATETDPGPSDPSPPQPVVRVLPDTFPHGTGHARCLRLELGTKASEIGCNPTPIPTFWPFAGHYYVVLSNRPEPADWPAIHIDDFDWSRQFGAGTGRQCMTDDFLHAVDRDLGGKPFYLTSCQLGAFGGSAAVFVTALDRPDDHPASSYFFEPTSDGWRLLAPYDPDLPEAERCRELSDLAISDVSRGTRPSVLDALSYCEDLRDREPYVPPPPRD